MKIAIVTHHTPNFIEMANITRPTKIRYAEKHGYVDFVKTDNFLNLPNTHPSLEKVFYLDEIMHANPDIDWFWYSGCDCLITNTDIKLESLIDENYHFIVCKDDHGINGDVFFIKNSHEGREYIKHMEEPHREGTEQGWMWDDEEDPKWRSITKYIPQNIMNAYDLKYYPNKCGHDVFNQRSNWQPGDFVLQAVTGWWPGFGPKEIYQHKINILQSHVNDVI
jgi:hypothetical protein